MAASGHHLQRLNRSPPSFQHRPYLRAPFFFFFWLAGAHDLTHCPVNCACHTRVCVGGLRRPAWNSCGCTTRTWTTRLPKPWPTCSSSARVSLFPRAGGEPLRVCWSAHGWACCAPLCVFAPPPLHASAILPCSQSVPTHYVPCLGGTAPVNRDCNGDGGGLLLLLLLQL